MAGPTWVKYISGDGLSYGARTTGLTPDELFFCENGDRAVTIAESSDPHSCYDYDDYALAELDGVYYVFNTSGCSCPSPSETWGLIFRGSKEELLTFLQWSADSTEAWHEFLREVERGGFTLVNPAPPEGPRRYDW